MDTAILIRPKDKQELAFLNDFIKRLNFSSSILNKDDLEDLGLLNAINKGRTKSYINTDSFLKKIKK